MAKKTKVAITGGIGSGKSKVLQIVAELGYSFFSCDEIYKSVIESPEYIQKIQVEFPACVINEKIDRRKLAEIVFSNEKNREILNSIAHPLIMNALFAQMNASATNVTFAEVPLLFEGNYEKNFDYVIVVQRAKNERIKAIKNRDGLSEAEIGNRMKTQIDYDSENMNSRLQKNNIFIVENNDTIEQLKTKILNILSKI